MLTRYQQCVQRLQWVVKTFEFTKPPLSNESSTLFTGLARRTWRALPPVNSHTYEVKGAIHTFVFEMWQAQQAFASRTSRADFFSWAVRFRWRPRVVTFAFGGTLGSE